MMFGLTDTHPDCNIQEVEYIRLLGFPRDRKLEDRTRELADGAQAWYTANGRPWIHARQADTLELGHDRLAINGTEFSSRRLHGQFSTAEAGSAILVAVSAGRECEEHAQALWRDEKPDEYFFLEAFGSAVVEHLIALANGRICGWAEAQGQVALPHFSPGYTGWDISEQGKLWELIRPTEDHPLPGDLHVMESGMLRPKKSQLAVVGITANVEKARRVARLVPCESCALSACQYRRTPYKRSPRTVLS